MPSRVHWVYVAGNPRFDNNARIYFQDAVRRKALDNLSPVACERVCRKLDKLPPSFRKALPILQEIATEWPTLTKKLRSFRLPKHIRRSKNPIYAWRNL